MERHEDSYDFRPVTAKDLPMIAGWLAEPHVAQWWNDPETEIAEIRDHIDSISVEPLIVELDGTPIAYLQSYDPHLEEDHPYADQPFGTLGIDLSIGRPELVGIGHGSAMVRQFVEQLFEEGVPRVIIDPDPSNGRAIRAYEKAGFRAIDRRQSRYGDVVLMAIDAHEAQAGDTEADNGEAGN
ncbi:MULTISPECIES: GNAT family N-acetyltransferase [unclassified Mesorhizobium]|uniref:GNAT family N-acetyltransferase n=1 Tax=unclassified Mesorhizobium TaxID=325217 RepID=UPI00112BE0B6|nr:MULTISPECIES: GNAT family N-acetyltransferase [unclassified Mesorhizobium]MBZ9961846.1 acetyltransferase [Mesorhizobium sp. BR1-1-14]TPL55305.1 acetyltransferase [Mesorhizobium sp. B2-4-4]TPM42491.1 acetyltransferase [Mesorhizobium sp. B2-2-3]